MHNIYTKDLVQTHVGSVTATSVSVSLFEPCLVDSEGIVHLVSSTPSGLTFF